jgi:1-acyl-sn-glycerol-3-phosphate acyltransferase
MLCILDTSEIDSLPRRGPGLLATNHTSAFEGPILFSLIAPRKTTGMAKRELWSNPFTRLFMRAWKMIPVKRDQVDTAAIRACLRALKDRYYIGIAPEGTRSRSGVLQEGRSGTALLAMRANAPIYPVAQVGFGAIGPNLLRARKTHLSVRVGRPFRVRRSGRVTTEFLKGVTDEIMSEIARLLPEPLRGPYRDTVDGPRSHIEFEGSQRR